ncbi:MAG: M42 family peptidase, partial [Eubacteriales bacterium]|nr:M42 family peptidase [Eubacteriales bacterium]
LGKGPMLRHIDRSMVTHPGFQRYALNLARERGIAVQEGVRSGGGTNGGLIHTEGKGIPTIVIGMPVRYIHTHYGWARLSDVEAAVELASALLLSFDADVMEKLIY